MRTPSWILPAAAVVAILTGTVFFQPATGAEEVDAKKLFVETHKCSMCHGVPGAGIEAKTKSEKMKGPDLGGKIDTAFEELAAYLRKAGELEGEEHDKGFKGTDEELQAILDWLGSLKAPQ